MKKLNAKHLEAARLIWEGKSYREVAEQLGAGHSSVKGWAIAPLFKAEIERLKKEEAVRVTTELDAAAEFQAELRQKTRDFYRDVQQRITDAIAILDDIGLSRSLPPLVKAMRDATELVLATDASTLGLEELAKEVDALNQT